MTGKQVKALALSRDKRRNRTSTATLLKVARKKARLKQRTQERSFAREQKERMDDSTNLGCVMPVAECGRWGY